MLGLLVILWAAPTMTAGHLLLTAVLTAYIAVGTTLEERDLRAASLWAGVVASYDVLATDWNRAPGAVMLMFVILM